MQLFIKKNSVYILHPNPVNTLPTNTIATLSAEAINIHPITAGMAANFIVFSRPMASMIKPADIEATGPTKTMIDATHDDCVCVIGKSLSGLSACGIKIAEKESAIPITM